jgi:serine/threonine protein kinase
MAKVSLGRYELLRRLSNGGMGEVHLARLRGASGDACEVRPSGDADANGDVRAAAGPLFVVKTLLPHLLRDPQMAVMFADEARIAARLVHPHICRVFELGADGETCFIAMEYVPGLDLSALQDACASRGRKLPVELACRIVADAAAGLHFAHSLCDADGRPYRIVHRDVSPQNVLVGFDGCVKVIDFGVAKARGRAQRTEAGELKGKFAYMSPEQASSGGVDHRADVFALGIVLHELLTGERLFKAATDAATLARVRACEVPSPTAAPEELQAIVLRALRRNPRERFQTAGELQLALDEWLSRTRAAAARADLAAFMRDLRSESTERVARPGSARRPSRRSPVRSTAAGVLPEISRVLTRVRGAKRMTAATLAVGALAIAIVLYPLRKPAHAAVVVRELSLVRQEPIGSAAHPIAGPIASGDRRSDDVTPRPAEASPAADLRASRSPCPARACGSSPAGTRGSPSLPGRAPPKSARAGSGRDRRSR